MSSGGFPAIFDIFSSVIMFSGLRGRGIVGGDLFAAGGVGVGAGAGAGAAFRTVGIRRGDVARGAPRGRGGSQTTWSVRDARVRPALGPTAFGADAPGSMRCGDGQYVRSLATFWWA
jgi:hypothetical protein